MRRWIGGLLIVLGMALAGCGNKKPPAIDFSQELAPGQVALRKLSLTEYPDFSGNMTDPAALSAALDNSLLYLSAPSSRQYYPYLDITHAQAVATCHALKALSAQQPRDPRRLNQQLRQYFDVYKSIGAPSPQGGYSERVLFTGYFTPIYDAALTRQGPFQFPLYKRPADLAVDPATLEATGRQTPGGIVPYYTRGEIEGSGVLAGSELIWLKSRWDAYVITIQGSARLRLVDGRTYEIGYAGTNGHAYESPGRKMLADGVISRDQLTLHGLAAYFTSHPEKMNQYLWLNNRYVFFAERPGGPFGSLNVPVTPMASIATDKNFDHNKNIYPRAMPAFLVTPLPSGDGQAIGDFRGFMMDQDTGGAIRAAGRCDIYMGVGLAAQRLAGRQLHEGELYYVALKSQYVSHYAPASQPAGR